MNTHNNNYISSTVSNEEDGDSSFNRTSIKGPKPSLLNRSSSMQG